MGMVDFSKKRWEGLGPQKIETRQGSVVFYAEIDTVLTDPMPRHARVSPLVTFQCPGPSF